MTTDLRSASSTDPAAWIIERIHLFAQDVGSVVPERFPAYARVFHPASSWTSDRSVSPVTWARIAEANGRIAHPEMQFENLVGMWQGIPETDRGQPPIWDQWPEEGSLPEDVGQRMMELLGPCTADLERCWFAAWDGWGDLRPNVARAPAFELPHRRYHLLEGPLRAALEGCGYAGFQSLSLWWPDDRAWCVATEIDFRSTYVGGSAECIARILTDPMIEALPAELHHGITFASDHLNPLPPQ